MSLPRYFDASYDVNDHWTLRAGLRYTRDETELNGYSARLLGSDGTPLVNTIPGDPDNALAKAADDDFSDDEWTGRLGIDSCVSRPGNGWNRSLMGASPVRYRDIR